MTVICSPIRPVIFSPLREPTALCKGGGATAAIGFHFLGDSMLDGGFVSDGVGALMSRSHAVTRDSVGGSTLIQQLDRYEATPQYYGSMLISVDALGHTGEGDVDEINAMNALNTSGEFLYVVPSINDNYTAGSANRITLDGIFDGIEAAYPTQFVNSIGTAIYYTDGTPNDAADAANLLWPRSLRSDLIHLNSAGRSLLIGIIAAKIISMGLDGNRVPVNNATPRITLNGADLEAFDGVWLAYPAATATYQWYADGVAIPGATGATYTTAGTETDVVFTVDVTYTNAGGTSTATSPGFMAYRTEFDSYSAETNALLNAMDTVPGSDERTVIDVQMARVQALAAKLDWFSAPLHSGYASRINWLDPSQVATAYLTSDFEPGLGFKMSLAADSRIDTGIVPSTAGGAWTLTSTHVGLDVTEPDWQSNAILMMGNVSTNLIWRQRSGMSVDPGSTDIRLNSTTLPTATMGGRDGHLVITRNGTALKPFRDGYPWSGSSTITDTASALPVQTVQFGRGYEGRIGAFHFGGHLDDADVVELTDIIETLAATFGLQYGIGEYDPDAQAYFDAMDVEPSADLKALYHDAIVAMKAQNLWNKYEVLYFLNAHDEQAGRLNVKDPSSHEITNNGAAFSPYVGFTGNSTSAYLDTNFNPSTDIDLPFSNAQSAVFWSLKAEQDSACAIGYAVSPALFVFPRNTSNNFSGRMFATSTTNIANSDGSGLYRPNRTGYSAGTVYKNGASLGTIATAAAAAPNENLLLLRSGSGYWGGGLAFGGYGYPLSPDEAAAEYAILYALKTGIEAL